MPTVESSLGDWHEFLTSAKAILGNADNDRSFVAALLAKAFLKARFDIPNIDMAAKPQGAPSAKVIPSSA